jgi:hypothetical protein
MKLYSYWRSSSSYRVRIALAFKGLAYEYVPINIHPQASEQWSPSFDVVNPQRQVPVLEIDAGLGFSFAPALARRPVAARSRSPARGDGERGHPRCCPGFQALSSRGAPSALAPTGSSRPS